MDLGAFRQMVAKNPQGFLGRFGLGNKLIQDGGNLEEAVEHLTVATQLDPTHVASHLALGTCPTLTVLLRRTIHDQLRRARPEKILNVFQRIRLRFFQACGLASGRTSFASSRTAMSDRLPGRALIVLGKNDAAKPILTAGIDAALSGRSNGGHDLVPELQQLLRTIG